MIFPGTDTNAFEKASKGWTKLSRSIRYKIYKAQNEKKQKNDIIMPPIQGALGKPKTYNPTYSRNAVVISATQKHRVQQTQRYSEKKNILDDIRDYRSSKIVSNISNSLATFIVRCGGHQWSNEAKNIVRSSIAFAISEVTNKSLEKPLEIINNIKLFFKIGKTVYRVITWIDKLTKLWTTNDKSISIVSDNDIEYLNYIREYPCLARSVKNLNICDNTMKYRVGDIVLLNNDKKVRINRINVVSKIYYVTDIEVNGLQYIIRESEICKLVKRV